MKTQKEKVQEIRKAFFEYEKKISF